MGLKKTENTMATNSADITKSNLQCGIQKIPINSTQSAYSC